MRVFSLRCWKRECIVCLVAGWLRLIKIFFYFLCSQVDCCHGYYSLLHGSSCWRRDAVCHQPCSAMIGECAVVLTASQLLTFFRIFSCHRLSVAIAFNVCSVATASRALHHCTKVLLVCYLRRHALPLPGALALAAGWSPCFAASWHSCPCGWLIVFLFQIISCYSYWVFSCQVAKTLLPPLACKAVPDSPLLLVYAICHRCCQPLLLVGCYCANGFGFLTRAHGTCCSRCSIHAVASFSTGWLFTYLF